MRIKRPIYILLCLSLYSSYTYAQSENTSRSFRALIDFTGEFGGDAVAEVYYTDGDVKSVHAGQGVSIGIGGEFTVPKMQKLKFRGWIGYKILTVRASNADMALTRVPINLTANWMITNNIRIGTGLAMQTGIKFDADGLGDNINFNNASGLMFELAWRWIGLRYTLMEYKDGFEETYNANALGLSVSFVFPN
ncbi:hypothetical protein [Flavivirga eckloniae]|uniref:Outer membrane protein beta-barrel domain-containing protein n=1 Tax=Flavivirga eckloniae TaxID=1803846 RepID=A0A2K9PQ87_9FLAO|nr:hypothetical protein [Flavivirga eckloniae]AUP79240.1 hypothetical protein C1H87_11200 [Flavivirga eckloniae]